MQVSLLSLTVLLVLSAAPATAQPTAQGAAQALRTSPRPEAAVGRDHTVAVWSARRTARPGDMVLLALGGVGGGLVVGAVAVGVDPPVGVRVALYGLGVAVGTTLTGRWLQIEGAPLGAFAGAAVGAGLVLLVAQTTGEGGAESLADAASVGLLALVLPPVLSTGGYLLAPTLSAGRSPGLALRVRL